MKDPCDNWLRHRNLRRYSQFFEDGVALSALERLSTCADMDRQCVEFGAGDGVHLSNTANLVESHGFSCVMIEADREKCARLHERWKHEPRVRALRTVVGWEGGNSLDELLSRFYPDVRSDFDYCSIDIDGNDYHVWESMRRYRPKLVCVEFNSTIPNEVRFVQPKDYALRHGASVLSLVDLGKDKGYELIHANLLNAFFVDRRYFGAFGMTDNSLHSLRRDMQHVTYVFQSVDGDVFMRGYRKNPWTGRSIDHEQAVTA